MINSRAEYYTKEHILKECHDAKPVPGKNRMGCSESWYDPFYVMNRVFGEGELGAMTERELNNIYAALYEMSAALY
jgi:hypothetical protein